MKLKNEKVRNEKYYCVGYNEYLNKYILATVVTWVVWYNRYFEISKEEYMCFENDIKKLDMLAKECNDLGNLSDRYLYADRFEENTQIQNDLMCKINEWSKERDL